MIWAETSGAAARLVEVRAEWEALVAADQAAATERVRRWDSRIAALRRERDALRGAGRWLAGRGDLLGVVGAGRSELVHSAVLAWLLDPMGRHQLGTRLLAAVVDRCSGHREPDAFASVLCGREVARAESIADVVVWADTFTLVIENKVDAPEGDRQCQRIYNDFSGDPDPIFVLLSPTGRRPRSTETPEAATAWRSLSYPALGDLIEAAFTHGARDRGGGRGAVVDYLMTLRKEFG